MRNKIDEMMKSNINLYSLVKNTQAKEVKIKKKLI